MPINVFYFSSKIKQKSRWYYHNNPRPAPIFSWFNLMRNRLWTNKQCLLLLQKKALTYLNIYKGDSLMIIIIKKLILGDIIKQRSHFRQGQSLCSRNQSGICQSIAMTFLCSAVGKMIPAACLKCQQLTRQPLTRQDSRALSEHRTANVTPYCFF